LAPAGIVNAQALAPFLRALAQLASPAASAGPPQLVRVLQFGDSHTAADFWSGKVRQRLQARFGDGGPGCILPAKPWRGYPHAGVSILAGQTWPAQSLRQEGCDGLVGLTGASLAPTAGATFILKATFAGFRVHLLGCGQGEVAAWTAPVPMEEGAPASPRPVPLLSSDPIRKEVCLELYGQDGLATDSPRELGLTFPDRSSLLGVDLRSGRNGVIYDELGLNGAELLDLGRWNPQLRRALLERIHPDLLVLAYGTNDMGMGAQALAEYQASVLVLLRELKEASAAPILVVGPLDRLGQSRARRASLKVGASLVITALREACAESGCAFWDARQAMGGYGALLKWRQAGLAQKDLVHLNGAGYQLLGDKLADALLKAYDTSWNQAPEPAARPLGLPVRKRLPKAPKKPRHRKVAGGNRSRRESRKS
jgi:lysophospholipase L1-like esterase